MLTTRVIPTVGRGVGRRHRRGRPPGRRQAGDRRRAADQHARPLARRVREPVLPRSLLRHERRAKHTATTDELLEQFRLADRARADVDRAVGRHGAAADGRAGDHARPRRAVPRRADVGPRSAEPPRALGRHRRAARATGQTIVLTTHYMEEADQLCERVAIIDHGRLLALDTPDALKATIGADTEVRIHATGDLDALVARPRAAARRRQRARRRRHRATRTCSTGGPTLPEIITHADGTGFAITDVGVTETDARDRVHRPDRKGPPRMTHDHAPRPPRRRARRRRITRSARCSLRDLARAAQGEVGCSSAARSCSRCC